MAEKQRAPSVTRQIEESIPGANPFNRLKADFAIILIIGLFLLILSGSWFDSESHALIFLLLYSISGAVWLIARTRRIAKTMQNLKHHGQE